MKRRKFLACATAGAAAFPAVLTAGCAGKREYDLLITGGTVFNGSGSPGIEADVAVKGDRIVAVGPGLNRKRAVDVIEAKGLAVSPGFIDPHTHTDVQIIANPKAESKIRQGVTLEVGGNCGYSYFPFSDRALEDAKMNVKKEFDVDVDWSEIGGFLARVEKGGTALNYATFLGQGALRDFVMGPYDRPPKPEELERMKAVIAENMTAGALGMSTGLEYTPGCFAKADEITDLCREVALHGGIYATHIRNENDEVLQSIKEAIDAARASGVSLQISHIKANYSRNWAKIDGMIDEIDRAIKDGVKVKADRYPYIASSTDLSIFFPKWAREGTDADFVNRLKDPALQGKLKAYIKEREAMMMTWDNVLLSLILSDKNRHFEGSTVLAASKSLNKTPYDFMHDILIEEDGRVGMVQFGMCEENLKRFYAHPAVTVGSDGNAVAVDGVLGKGKPHPRFYGTFPRYLGKYVRDEKVLPLEEGIRRITSFTAEKLGIEGRGILAPGMFADIVVFDPGTIIDKATFANPHQYPEGIPHVVVNGIAAVRNGEHTGALPGRVLRKKATA